MTDQAQMERDLEDLAADAEAIGAVADTEKDRARRVALERLDNFNAKYKDASVCVMPPVGLVFLSAEGQIKTTLFSSFEARFDWSAALPLMNEIERFAEEAREWWPRPDEDPKAGDKLPFLERLVQAVLSPVARVQRVDAERRPHSNAAFALLTWVLKAIYEEDARHAGETNNPPTPLFQAKLGQIKHETQLAKQRLAQAMQRSAQTRYWYGALLGFVFLALICVALAVVFLATETPAFYGVAVPAGGLGAMVSLLQRMSTGRLKLDTTASRDLLELFGGVRPLIGAIFGIVIAAAIKGGFFPAIHIPAGQELAFFAVVGFLAGFNERWAQDMLKSSGNQLKPLPESTPTVASTPATGLEAGPPPETPHPAP